MLNNTFVSALTTPKETEIEGNKDKYMSEFAAFPFHQVKKEKRLNLPSFTNHLNEAVGQAQRLQASRISS